MGILLNFKIVFGFSPSDKILFQLSQQSFSKKVIIRVRDYCLCKYLLNIVLTQALQNNNCFLLVGCGGVLKGRSGSAKTPNFPLQYPNNQDCRWSVDVQRYFNIKLSDVTLNLPGKIGRCQGDKLEVRMGTTINGKLLHTLCGDYDQEIGINYNQLMVRFLSDNVTEPTYKGAAMKYTAGMSSLVSTNEECKFLLN